MGLDPRQHEDVSGRPASLRAASLFIDSQILVRDCAFSDLVMVEAQYLFRRSSRHGGYKKSKGSFCIFDLLEF